MDFSKTTGLSIAVIIIAALILWIGNPSPSVNITIPDQGTEVGKKIPNLSFMDFQGKIVSFSDFPGKNLIINSWAAWCPFCISEMPDLQKASDENYDVAVLFIHRTATESVDTAKKYIEGFDKPITGPVLSDPEDAFYKTFFGFGMPVTLFADKDGVIKFKKVGPMNGDEIRSNIEKFFRVSQPSSDVETIKTLPDGTKYLVHPDEILPGGPPKGGIGVDVGIAALAEGQGKFISASEAVFLDDNDLVLGLNYKGKTRAYPHQILVYHEIVNDNINDIPVLVTYCPLCLTGIAFSRQIQGIAPQFGTSGKLYNSNLVMYDNATDSYWYQQTGQAIVGPLTGTKLEWIPLDTAKWGDWKKQHPDTDVLSRETGFSRPYGVDPYGSYYTSGDVGFGANFTDKRLHPKVWIHGIEIKGKAKAYPRDEVAKVGLVNDVFEGISLLVVQDPLTEVVRIYSRNVNGSLVTFELRDGKLIDNLGNEWDFNGISKGSTLERIPDHFGFWFSWSLAYPGTELFSVAQE